MYSNKLGRFTTVDPLLGSGRVELAQSWNRYVYVLNNPLISIDPSGLYECKASGDECDAIRTGLARINHALGSYKEGTKERKSLQRILDSYGCDSSICGEKGKNGVTIWSYNLKKSEAVTQTEGIPGTKSDYNDSGRDTRVVIDKDVIKNFTADDLASILAHEGSHVADDYDWVKSGFSEINNPALYQSETDAFYAGGYVAQKLVSESISYSFKDDPVYAKYLLGGVHKYRTYSSGWAEIDKSRAENINGIVKNVYGVSPDSKVKALTPHTKFKPDWLNRLEK